MKTRVYISIILMVLMVSGIIHVAAAQDIVAGVKPGDEFTYVVTGSYPTDDPTLDIPQQVIDAHATDHFKLVIDSVSGPEVGYTWYWYFNNGSKPQNGSDTVNIETTANTGPFWAIVSANLNTTQRIHPHFGPDLSVFNETGRIEYANYTREANRLQLEFAYQNNVTGATYAEYSDTYFDKQTGILIQLSDVSDYQNPAFVTAINWKLTETNAWTSSSSGSFAIEPFFTLPVIITIVVVVAVVVVVLAVWAVSSQRKKARKRAILKKR